jgi:alpha-ketoglutarate-dependent taurine dioxygenase
VDDDQYVTSGHFHAWATDLQDEGIVVLDEAVERVEEFVRALGRQSAPQRLRPREADGTNSHSGRVGLGCFPWHTDGALAVNPPDFLVLRNVGGPSPVPTEVLRPSGSLLGNLERVVLTVRHQTGRVERFVAALPSGGSMLVRWDPRVAESSVPEVLEVVESTPSTQSICWLPGRTVILNNRRLLHRRPPAHQDLHRDIERRYVWSE